MNREDELKRELSLIRKVGNRIDNVPHDMAVRVLADMTTAPTGGAIHTERETALIEELSVYKRVRKVLDGVPIDLQSSVLDGWVTRLNGRTEPEVAPVG